MAAIQKHYRVCNLCEAMCGLEIEHDGQKVLSVKGDENDPFSKGSLCPKGALIHKLHEDPDRLKTPLLKKDNGEWEEIEWEKAFDIIGEKINGIRKQYGNDSVAMYLGNPNVHNMGMMLFSGEIKRSLRTKNFFTATSMDQLPHHFVGYHVFGHSLNLPIPDINRTDYFIMFGANPMVSNGSLMSGCGPAEKIKTIQDRGGKVILFDPRATETSRVVDEHYYIKPSTDVYFLLGMVHLIQKNNWINLRGLEKHIANLENIKNIAAEFTPEKVASLTGVSAEVLLKITTEFIAQKRAVLYGRMGMSTQEHGGLCQWLSVVINILTGHFDCEGGAMFTTPAVDIKRRNKWKQSAGRWHSRVRKFPEFDGELPVSTMADEMLTEGEGQVRALITSAGNPVLSTPNGKRLEEALPKLDFMVSIDIFLNETTRHADIILPPPSHLEIDHYDLIFNHLAVSNNAKFSERLFEPQKGQKYDWEIVKELTKRFGKLTNYKSAFTSKHFTPRQLLNIGLMTGPYGKLSSASKLFGGLSLKKLIKSKHGIHLGPLQPRIPEVLNTKDRKIHLGAEVFVEGLKELRTGLVKEIMERKENEFQLIGRRQLRSNNSWMHNVDKLMKGKNRCTVMINSSDAAALHISNKEVVLVKSTIGEIKIPAELTDSIMSGVISIPHGFGHKRKGTRLSIASDRFHAGVSMNDITDHNRLDKLTGNAAFSGQLVRISKLEDKAAQT